MLDLNKQINILKIIIILIIIISFGAFLYRPHFDFKFGGGDNLEWYQEAKERNTIKKVWDFQYYSGRQGPSAYYNPLQLIIWQYMSNNYEKQHQPYHFLIILFHMANAIAFFFLVNKFIKNKFFSLLAALSFETYYLNFYAMAWIAGGICWGLIGLSMLSIFYLTIKYFETKNILLYLLSLLIFFIGTFIKEAIVFIVPMLLAYYLIKERRPIFKFIKKDLFILPYFILSLPIVLITLIRMKSSAIVNNWGGLNFGVHMFYKFIDFFNYLITIIPVSFGAQMAITTIVLIFLPLLIYYGFKKDKNLLFFSVWLILLILTYTFQNFRDIYTLGRYLYLPSIAWFALLYYMVSRIKNLKIKIISSFFLINYTIILNLFFVLTRK